MNEAQWKYVAARLEGIDQDDCLDALQVVQRILQNPQRFDGPRQEVAVCGFLWGCLTRALDRGDFSEAQTNVLDAMEAEMAGHTQSARLALGWLQQSPSAPAEEPSLADVGL